MLSEANFVSAGLHARRVEYLARRHDSDGILLDAASTRKRLLYRDRPGDETVCSYRIMLL